MSRPRFFHNPRCSKSREALALLEERCQEVEVIEYLKTPPSFSTIERICKILDVHPADLVRSREKRFRELGLSKEESRTKKEWIQILHDNPSLMERPIVIYGKRGEIGRPPEKVLNVL